MTDLKALSAHVKLGREIEKFTKMLEGDYFSICEVRDLLLEINHPQKYRPYKTLHNLHCIQYKDMPPVMLLAIPGLLSELFRCSIIHIDINKLSVDTSRMRIIIQPGAFSFVVKKGLLDRICSWLAPKKG